MNSHETAIILKMFSKEYFDIKNLPALSNNSSTLEHEATVSKISDNQLFYLESRGLSEKEAMELIIMGFIEPFARELPLEYAVELNQLIKLELE